MLSFASCQASDILTEASPLRINKNCLDEEEKSIHKRCIQMVNTNRNKKMRINAKGKN